MIFYPGHKPGRPPSVRAGGNWRAFLIGVSYAPDPNGPPNAQRMLPQLNALQGADFDAAYANAQLAVQTEAVDQFGAFSQNGNGAPLRRYAQMMLPKSKMFLEYAKRLAGSR